MTAELIVADADAWRAWLGEHHQGSDGVWLVLAKKDVTSPTSLTYDQALEEALCHGWIDGQRRSRDERIGRATADGRWDNAYGGSSTQEIPTDLAEALAAVPQAQALFDILTSANRFAVVHRVNSAKRAETRAKRIAQFVEQLARGETIYPQKRTL